MYDCLGEKTIFKKQKQQANEQEIPEEAYDLASTHQLGQPLACYLSSLLWLRFSLDFPRAMLIVTLCAFILSLSLDSTWLFQLLTVHKEYVIRDGQDT